MSRWLKKRSGKTGLSPGSLVHIGERLTEETKFTVLDYDEEHIEEKDPYQICAHVIGALRPTA